MIVGLYQTPQPESLEDGLQTIDKALAAAAECGTAMLVFPEAYLPGYTAVSPQKPEGGDDITDQLGALCRKHETALTIGLPDYAEGHVYNAAYAFGEDGRVLARYRKIQLFGPDETALYTPGEEYALFDYRGTRFGLLICYDMEFPEHCRAMARRGAEVILVPTANMMPFVNVNQILAPARAAENGVTIVYANYCGAAGDLEFTGLSAIFGPDGYILGAKGNGPGLCIAKLPSGWSEHGIPVSTQLTDLRDPADPNHNIATPKDTRS